MRGVVVVGALVAVVFGLTALSAVVALPGEGTLKRALGFRYGPTEPRCEKVHGSGPAAAWRAEAALPTGRDEARAVAVGGSAYIVGGIGSDAPPAGRSVATFERYRFADRRYESLPPLPMALNHVGMAVHDGDIYVIGGLGESRGRVVATNRAFRFRPERGRWEELAPMREARGAHGLAVVDDRVYAIGGRRDRSFDASLPSVGLVESYDVRSGRWSAHGRMPEPRDHLGVAAHGGSVYVMAGRRPDGTPLRRFDRYDPVSGRWAALPPVPNATSGIDLVASGDRLLTGGGEQPEAGRVLGSAWGYDVAQRRWRQLPRLPSPRHGYASVAAGGRWYVFGGSTCPGFRPTREAASLDVRS